MHHPRERHHPADGRPRDMLRREIKFLGFELGRVIRQCAGHDAYELVERIRALAKARRAGDVEADAELQRVMASLSAGETSAVIRAFACFFDLANIAEDRQRTRVLRERELAKFPAPRSESIAAAVAKLRDEDVSGEQLQAMLDGLDVELVFTAHPTEAKRRTVRRSLRRLRGHLGKLDSEDFLPSEREAVIGLIRADIAGLWHTDPLRASRPTVLGEVRRSFFLLDSLWHVVPRLYSDMRRAVAETYPDDRISVGRFLHFGTWIGGDRDGNPFVTPAVTAEAIAMLRQRTFTEHLAMRRHMSQVLSLSSANFPLPEPLIDAIERARQSWPECFEKVDALHPDEHYRHWLAIVDFRLRATSKAKPWDPNQPLPRGAYAGADELIGDLQLIRQCLLAEQLDDLADGDLQKWIDCTSVFGFQFARLDIREHSRVLEETVAAALAAMGLGSDFGEWPEERKVDALTDVVNDEAIEALRSAALGQDAAKTVALFRLIDQLASLPDAKRTLGAFIISMSHAPSDVLSVVWLRRVAARLNGRDTAADMPIAPLFETIDDLHHAAGILDRLLANRAYREVLAKQANRQMCMIGYSDSAKDGGYLASSWALYEAQRDLAATACRHGIELVVFHGRGGSLGRGGGPAARGIEGLPPEAVVGKLRVTEQGEVLAERYDDPRIAHRHLEQVISATMRVSARPVAPPAAEWTDLVRQMAAESCRAYRALIERDDFVPYFETATPIVGIENLPIASRPTRRTGQRTVGDLRAIPYTFAWTQNRHLITAYFGMGEPLKQMLSTNADDLLTMYHNWPWFHGLIENATLALSKADLGIAAAYAALHGSDGGAGSPFDEIRKEFKSARKVVLGITGEETLLADVPWLAKSIGLRNPYIDPLNLIQVGALRHLQRLNGAEDEEQYMDLLRHSIQGIAAGMRTTG